MNLKKEAGLGRWSTAAQWLHLLQHLRVETFKEPLIGLVRVHMTRFYAGNRMMVPVVCATEEAGRVVGPLVEPVTGKLYLQHLPHGNVHFPAPSFQAKITIVKDDSPVSLMNAIQSMMYPGQDIIPPQTDQYMQVMDHGFRYVRPNPHCPDKVETCRWMIDNLKDHGIKNWKDGKVSMSEAIEQFVLERNLRPPYEYNPRDFPKMIRAAAAAKPKLIP
jgi:hypothetical protein